MKFKKLLATSTVSVIAMLSYSAIAQMRPECGADPDKAGACFYNVIPGGVLSCEDGGIFWPPYEDEVKQSTGKVNPNGKVSVHLAGKNLPAFACTAADAAMGICPGPGIYAGETHVKVNGFITPDGGLSCPYKATAKGTLYRDVGFGPEEIEIDLIVHVGKDTESNSCKLKQCTVFAAE